jgi:serine/threonine protein kinase
LLSHEQLKVNPTRRDPPPPGTIIASYRLAELVGSGGLSWVYRAHRPGNGPPVAVKLLRGALVNLPGFVKRFEREAEICQRMNHPNCVRLFDYGVYERMPYLVMQLVDGVTLHAAMRRKRPTPKQSVSMVRQVCTALEHAHDCGVIHRDLKPGNIMIPEIGPLKVLDFGTGIVVDGPPPPGRGTDVGTPAYMAPEQIVGRPAGPYTDLYALGVILFELLTSRRPFTADSPRRVLQMHLACPVPSVRLLARDLPLSPELENVIMRAMQKDPEGRFANAGAFEAALAATPEAKARARRGRLGQRPGSGNG